MQFSLPSLFITALALPNVLAAPSANEIHQGDGITLKLAEAGMIQRIGADGQLLGERPLSEDQVETFAKIASQSQSERRDDGTLFKRQCLYGHPCTGDETCWFNGCSGCLFVTTNSGVCI
ncbi:uncharacterized protein F5Z01DRAFT_151882 [Emericellopsis atlantica]|uniref:Uncharacterized protein n=1 Tax=Emericellopsis atlantica TaxID=2614577 RepID=A0A9P7ZL17_9HYPO|nr:uncharacterized protein F5Z01DRAFT_151882 [Emericellopsis atlantica]KAG9253652.1 hypothetical protein F5Z01DRAFT_151882 [Emericellopsis atlantica]